LSAHRILAGRIDALQLVRFVKLLEDNVVVGGPWVGDRSFGWIGLGALSGSATIGNACADRLRDAPTPQLPLPAGLRARANY